MNYNEELIRMNILNLCENEKDIKTLNNLNEEQYAYLIDKISKVKVFVLDCECSENDIYYCIIDPERKIYKFYYFDGVFSSDLTNSNGKNEKDKKIFLFKKYSVHNLYNIGIFPGLSHISKGFEELSYKIFYEKLSDESKFVGFTEVYRHEFNSQCPKYIIDEVRNLIPKDIACKIKESKLMDKDGYMTVYREIGDHIIEPQKGIAWAYDVNVTKSWEFNSDMFNCKMVSGKVHVDDIIMICDTRTYDPIMGGEYCPDFERYEADVLLVPGTVKEITVIDEIGE